MVVIRSLSFLIGQLHHRDFATTANTDSHLLQGAADEAVEKMSAMMRKRAAKVDPGKSKRASKRAPKRA